MTTRTNNLIYGGFSSDIKGLHKVEVGANNLSNLVPILFYGFAIALISEGSGHGSQTGNTNKRYSPFYMFCTSNQYPCFKVAAFDGKHFKKVEIYNITNIAGEVSIITQFTLSNAFAIGCTTFTGNQAKYINDNICRIQFQEIDNLFNTTSKSSTNINWFEEAMTAPEAKSKSTSGQEDVVMLALAYEKLSQFSTGLSKNQSSGTIAGSTCRT